MRQVYDDRPEAERRGHAARRDVEAHFGERAIADLIGRRLRAIEVRRHFDDFRSRARSAYASYRALGDRVRESIREIVPAEATVLVVSKGDPALLELDGRPAWHYPRTEGGAYAGYYPADGDAAIEHLEALRAQGADYLLFPSTARWWLDHYTAFRQHLDTRYTRVVENESCVVYRLAAREGALPGRQAA
jgi:hypothetical protein